MRRRSVILLSIAALALAGSAAYVRHALRARDALRGLDVEGALASGEATAALGGASQDAPSLPTVAELAELADPAALRAHVAALDAELAGAPDEAARGPLHVLLSVALRGLGEHAAAREHAERGVALLPANSRARHALAGALAAELIHKGRVGGWTAVLTSLDSIGRFKGELAAAITLDSGNLAARDDEIAVYLFAPWPIGGESYALERIASVEALDPVRGVLWRAQVLAQDDREAEALALLDAPDSPLAARADLSREERNRVALVRGELLLALDRHREAVEAFAPALADPRLSAYHLAAYETGKACQRGGFELERALALFDAYLAAEPLGVFMPTLAGAWYRRGLVLRDLGRTEDARASYRRALALEPGFDRARAALDEL